MDVEAPQAFLGAGVPFPQENSVLLSPGVGGLGPRQFRVELPRSGVGQAEGPAFSCGSLPKSMTTSMLAML